MRKYLLLATLLAAAIPTPSQAIISMGLRLGAGMPAGDVYRDTRYKDFVSSQVPLQVDVMFGAPSLQLGLYGGYGFNNVNKSQVPAGMSASSSTMRAGVQVTSRLVDLGLAAVWAGLGSGYETIQYDLKSPATGTTTFKARGWEFATVSAGVDLAALPLLSVGLYASAGFGRFGVGSLTMGGVTQSAGLGPDKRTHELYQIGVRGMLNL